MSIRIAGRIVEVGDRLYHKGFGVWGYVNRYDPSGAAELTIKNSNGASRGILVREGGMVNGIKMVYWHGEIALDMPYDGLAPLQATVDVVAAEITRIWSECNVSRTQENQE